VSRVAWLLLAGFVLSRAPLLGGGFGSDDDSWRNAVAALRMREIGHYIPSRVPGFPLFEGLMAGLIRGGPNATNGAAALAGLAATILFWRLLRARGVREPIWPLLAFAFGAPLWIRCTQSMDYAFGLAFFLAAWLAALSRRYGPAGILVALATGCRPSYALASLPMLVLMQARREPPRRFLAYGLGLAPLTAALFTPVLLSPEAEHLERHIAHHAARAHVTAGNALWMAKRGALFALGRPGLLAAGLAIAAALAARWRRRSEPRPALPGAGAVRAFEVSLALSIGGFWLLIPYDEAYLLPLVPLALIALARSLPRAWLVATMLAITAEPLVSIRLDARLVPGELFQEIAERRRQLAEVRALLERRPTVPTVYVVGRAAVLRLLVLDPSLARMAPAWSPFHQPGVALVSRDGRRSFAEDLEPGQEAALASEGRAVERVRFSGR
jgi:hypothetical protein